MGESGLTPNSALRWRLRRGMKELDVVFERYHRRHYAGATAAEREGFERLLGCEDPEIWSWLMAQSPVPPQYADVISALRRDA